ncbi:MAG: DUF2179 domain-containing protein [Methanoregulaceae archaeon]
MISADFFTSPVFAWVVLPIFIFLARICDVSLGTIRVIFISKGIKYLAPLIGFFEVIIWLIAISQVMQNLTNPISYIAYGAGFACGTFIGMSIEERLSIGLSLIRIIIREDARDLMDDLRRKNYGVTSIDAEGATGQVEVLLMVAKRQDLGDIVATVKIHHPSAFYTIEDVRTAKEGVFPQREGNPILAPLGMLRLGK